MEKILTTKEFALAIGASESSLRRWTNSGAIQTARTVGGHRRIALSEAIRFIRETRTPVLRPEVLGLPAAAVRSAADQAVAGADEDAIDQALAEGDSAGARGRILGLYLAGTPLAAILDGPVSRAMSRVGALWEHDGAGILTEHRATDIALGALHQLRQLLSPAGPSAPVALGAAPSGDPYLMPSLMAAIVCAEAGYRETNFGPNTPVELLAKAAEDQKASLVWLSVSVADLKPALLRGVAHLADRLRERGAHLVLGGRHAESLVPPHASNVHALRTMTEFAAYIRGAKPGARLTASSA